MTLDGTVFDFKDRKDLSLSLLGSYQPINATNVLSAIELLRAHGVAISDGAIRRGLASTVWHARFEVICKDPLIIADGGHNPEGVDGAIESVKRYFPTDKVGLVTGVMADKDYQYMAKRMAEVASDVFCLTPDNPRALPAEDYARVFSSLGVNAIACGSIEDAVASALLWAKKTKSPVICLGSLYMYGDIVKALGKQ